MLLDILLIIAKAITLVFLWASIIIVIGFRPTLAEFRAKNNLSPTAEVWIIFVTLGATGAIAAIVAQGWF